MIPADPRRLHGLRIGLSISVPPDMQGSDDPQFVINATTFRMGSFLLTEGASLVLGHKWRPDGVLDHLTHRAVSSRWAPLGSQAGERPAPRILNLLAWPDLPPDDDSAAQRLIKDGILEIRQVRPPGFPDDFLDKANSPEAIKEILATPEGKLARIRAFTAMRQDLVAISDARLCLGGASGAPDRRRLPGLIEEAILTFLAGRALYISSALGGASKAMSDVILQRRMPDEAKELFFSSPAVVSLIADLAGKYPPPAAISMAEYSAPSVQTAWNALEFFQSTVRLEKLASQSGLNTDEYINLLTTPDPNRALGWMISGIERIRKVQGPL